MARDIKKYVKGVGVKPVTTTGITEKGEIESLDASGKLNYHNGTTASPVVTEAHTATLTNKTLTSPTVNGGTITSATIDTSTINNSTLNNPSLSNPTGITKSDVGLGNVDNTSDLNKPISTATQTALDDKANETLNNLTTTSINADLIADTDNTRALGSDAVNWSAVNTRSVISNEGISLTSGDTSASSTGDVTIKSKNLPATGTTGNVYINSGTQSTAAGASGNVTITSGPAVSSTGSVIIGSANATGTSGDVFIRTGNGAGATGSITLTTGTGSSRGNISLSASGISVNGTRVTNVGTPTANNDAATKAYVDNNTLSNNTPNEINALTVKATPVNADVLLIEDSADSFNKKKVTVGSLSTGGGDINFLQLSNVSWNAESGTTGFVTYKDAVASRPENGVDGTATLVSVTTSATTPLTGSNSLHIIKASGNAQGEGVSAAFNIDNANQARVLKVEFDYNIVSGVFTAGTQTTDSSLIVYLYDTVNNVLIEPSTFKLFSNSTTIADKFQGTFQTSSNSTAYRLIFHVATSATDAFTVRIDSVVVTPSKYVFGTPITDWQSYTPTITTGTGSVTNLNVGAWWRRVGSDLEVRFDMEYSAASATFNGFYMSLPSGLAITSDVDTSAYAHVGEFTVHDGGNAVFFGHLVAWAGNRVAFRVATTPTHVGTVPNSTIDMANTFPMTTASGDDITGSFSVPIQGWSSSVKMSDGFEGRNLVLSSISATNSSIPDGSFVMLYSAPNFQTGGIDYNPATGLATVRKAGTYFINASVQFMDGGYSTSIFGLDVFINGTTLKRLARRLPVGMVGHFVSGNTILDLRAGDTFDIRATKTYGANSNLITTDGACKLEAFLLANPSTTAQSEVVAATVYFSGNSFPASGTTTLTGGVKLVDTHSIFNTATGVFTIPVTGLYEISGYLYTASKAWALNDKLEMMLSSSYRIAGNTANSATTFEMQAPSAPIILLCTAGQSFTAQIFSSGSFGGSLSASSNFSRIVIKKVG